MEHTQASQTQFRLKPNDETITQEGQHQLVKARQRLISHHTKNKRPTQKRAISGLAFFISSQPQIGRLSARLRSVFCTKLLLLIGGFNSLIRQFTNSVWDYLSQVKVQFTISEVPRTTVDSRLFHPFGLPLDGALRLCTEEEGGGAIHHQTTAALVHLAVSGGLQAVFVVSVWKKATQLRDAVRVCSTWVYYLLWKRSNVVWKKRCRVICYPARSM